MPSRALAAALLAAFSGCSCDAPSSSVDPHDLMGVFDRDAGAQAASSAAPSGSSSAAEPASPRAPSDPGCVHEAGAADANISRVAGRPACRAAEVLEWRDPSGAPRYACFYAPSDLDARGKLPLVVFFHGTGPGLDTPSSLAKLTSLRAKMGETDLGREGQRGFTILAVQGRAIAGGKHGTTFDADHVSPDNLDKLATDHFVSEIVSRNVVDERRIFALGMGRGGQMAITYAMLRADRVAAFAAFAPIPPKARWSCPGPPPPGIVVYRACDAVASCEDVEAWLLDRDEQKATTKRLRLGEDAREEPSCAVRNRCTPKKAEAHHHRWPKARETDILAFLSGYRIE